MNAPLTNCDLFESNLTMDDPNLPTTDDKNTAEKAAEQATVKKRGRPKKVNDGSDSSPVESTETSIVMVESGTDVNPDVNVDTNSEPEKPKPSINLLTAIDPQTTPADNILSPDIEHRPCYRCYSDFWKDRHGNIQKAGVWFHSMGKGDDPKPIDSWVCGEILIIAIARDKVARSFGQVLQFKNKLGHWQIWNMPTRLLAGRGDELLKELLDMGLAFNYAKRNQIAAYICSIHPTKTVWTASQVGWFDKHNFVLPDATIGEDSDGIIFQSEGGHSQEYDTAGTLEQWRNDCASLCVGNALMVFSTSVAFAGALLKPCNMDGIGFHIFGESSRGKSTGLKLAVSVWGNDKHFMKTWKATANGLEGAASQSNDGLLALDEMGDCEAKELNDSLYLLGNGKGKQRANVTGGARAIRTWQIATLSNGEHDIQTHLAKKGFTVKAGQLVRMIQIPVFGQYGAFDNLHGQQDGRGFSDTVKEKANTFYGVAGRAYLEQLTRDHDTLEQLTRHLDSALNKITAPYKSLSPQELRTARAFALVAVAGELATSYGITGWNEGAAFESALSCFEQWHGYRGAGDTEDRQIKEAIQAYVEMYGDARFTHTNDENRLHGMRSGYLKDGIKGREWLFSKSGLMEATKGYDLKKVVDVLKQCGWLMLDGQGKSTRFVRLKNNELNDTRFYFICFNSDIEKIGATGATSATPYGGAAYSVAPTENISATSATTEIQASQSVAPVAPAKNESATAQPALFVAVAPVALVAPEKNKTESATELKNKLHPLKPNQLRI